MTAAARRERSLAGTEIAAGTFTSTAPVKLSRPETTLEDKYVLEQGTIFLTGIQALVRVLLDQRRADVRHGIDAATFVSGYQGSPLGGFDKEVMRLGKLGADSALHFVAGLNEELPGTPGYRPPVGPNPPAPPHGGGPGG